MMSKSLRRVSQQRQLQQLKKRGSVAVSRMVWICFLDFFEEEVGETVWCWKDDRTRGASQTFTSKRKALDAWRNDKLIFDPPP